MVLQGKFKLKAPIQKVWDALLDPQTLLSCVPGVEKLEKENEKTFSCVVKQKVGPISVKFNLKSVLVKADPPKHMEFEGEGKSKVGQFTQKSTVDFTENPDGEVEVSYKAEVNIVGKLATFGDRILRAKAKKVEEEFTKALREKLEKVV